MRTLHIYDELATLAPTEGTDEYREVAKRIVRLQERITNQRRDVEQLEVLLAGAKAASFRNEDDIADMTRRLDYLKNDTAQHEVEMTFWVSRLDQFRQPSAKAPRQPVHTLGKSRGQQCQSGL
jgi:uncharacterized coiled-coil protein SlyX